MLKCCCCKNLVYPQFKYEENEEITWGICSNCDIYNLTREQQVLFESTINKLIYPKFKILSQIDWTKPKPIIVNEEDNERYAKVDI